MARFCDSNQKRGVTLVELIVVLVILAVLAALLVPSLTGYIDKAVEKRIMLQARSLMTAAQATIDEAYAKGELHIDDNGGFKPLNVDTAHKLAKQIIELSELHIIHSLAKPDWLVLYQQTAIEELESLF